MSSFITRRALSSGTTATHYVTHRSSTYELAYFYSSEPNKYTTSLCDKVKKIFGFSPDGKKSLSKQQSRRLVDIGGGTGNFTASITSGCDDLEAVVLDPFLEATDTTTDHTTPSTRCTNNIKFIRASAEDFIKDSSKDYQWWRQNNNYCLMKEVVHYYAPADRVDIFRGVNDSLLTPDSAPPSPSLLIITRPKYDIDYPLWPAARNVWANNQPHVDEIERDLLEAGFQNVTHRVEKSVCNMGLEQWLDMVKGRCWSTFSNFSDDELVDACEIIRKDANVDDSTGEISFEDRLLFITAFK